MGNLNFQPTPEFPALQYLDSVDPGSQAERAGLRGGDFILEVGTRGMTSLLYVSFYAERAGLRGGDLILEVGTRGMMSMLYVSFINSNRLADRPRGWGLGAETSSWR